MDSESPELLIKKIEPLEDSKIWKSSALELKAFIFLKNGQIKNAIETFESISSMPSTPSSLSNRSRNMLDLLKVK